MNKNNPPNAISVLIPCRLEYRDFVGVMIRHLCNRLEARGEPEEFGHHVISSFNEAFNNIALRGGSEMEERSILIIVKETPEQLVIEIRDNGIGFDFRETLSGPNDLRESRIGLFIMRSFMNNIEYRENDNGVNILRMYKTITKGMS